MGSFIRSALFILFATVVLVQSAFSKITNDMIYEKLIEMEKRQAVFETQLRELKDQIDKRFEQIDKRFEQIDKRFEDVNRRFSDANNRIDELRSDINARFEQLYTFLWIIASLFSALVAVVVGFALWDRRTTIERSKKEAIREIEKVYGVDKLNALISSLRELAKENKRLEDILRSFGLF